MSDRTKGAFALAATAGPIALLANWAGWSPIAGVVLAMAGGVAAFLLSLATIEPSEDGRSNKPLLDSGRWGLEDWVETEDGIGWVDAARAITLRKAASKVEVAPTVDGFKLVVPRTRAHAPLAESVQLCSIASAAGWFVFLVVVLSNRPGPGLHPMWVIVGGGGLVLMSSVFYLLLAWLVAAVLGALGGVKSQRVKVEGRVLTVGGERFVLGQAGQRALLTHGWRGTQLELSNGRETLVLRGRHAELFELQRQLQRIKGAGSAKDIPQALRSLQSS